MKRLKNEINSLVNRGVDRHLRLAVTGLSRSGKTAFITAMVNQLLNIHAGARLPLLSCVREERLLGVKRVPQRDFGIPRFTYDEGLAQLYGSPPTWPTPTGRATPTAASAGTSTPSTGASAPTPTATRSPPRTAATTWAGSSPRRAAPAAA